jgi:hypothetical protein
MEPEQVVDAQLDAFNARDIDCFLASYGAEAVLEDGAGNMLARGHGAVPRALSS